MDAINTLLEEHKVLLQAIETSKEIQKIKDNDRYFTLMYDMIIFFRNFSEIYHHPKEEGILYPILRNRSANLSTEFMHEICDSHEDFKSIMAEIENVYILYDYKQLRILVSKYMEYLEDHIKKENKIILSVSKSLLNERELDMVATEFDRLDNRHGDKAELINSFYKVKSQFEKSIIEEQ
ncbi:MAG: hemerythrin domain-containing protein [Bacteroidetes bacterium]|nr:hemerythrin domain-containing protein [Bacteroidota bacterium]